MKPWSIHIPLLILLANVAGWLSADTPQNAADARAGHHKAPVEDRKQTDAKNKHAPADAKADDDWTRMKAWNNGASNLAQTGHVVQPAGKSLRIKGRVMSIALARGGNFLVVKTDTTIAVVDAEAFKLVKLYPFGEHGSMHGLAAGPDGNTIYFTGAKFNLYSARIDAQGELNVRAPLDLSGGQKVVNPLGVALSPDGKLAVVALSVANEAAVVDLAAWKVIARIPVGVCPYSVAISHDGRAALVSNFGGSRARKGDASERSAGSPVAVDPRGVALRGTVSVIDLKSLKAVAEITTRIHPEEIVLSPDGRLAYVIDDSGDGVSVIDVARRAVVSQIDTKPRADLPYGSLTDALALSPDGKTLYTANAGNNAIGIIDLSGARREPAAFIPAGGFPGSICVHGNDLFIGNVYGNLGDLQKVALPATEAERRNMTKTAESGFHFAEIVRAQERAATGVRPRPVPAHVGEPATIKHVVYIIKENKKYDQVLGDIGRGNSNARFCEFPRSITPNTHALADQFVLLDNYYCSGVRSSDGHQWATQGITSPYREKDWDSVRCTYDFGVDPLCYAGCGFIWDHLLRQGVSFRNFGELDYPVKTRGSTWSDFYRSWKNHDQNASFRCAYYLDTLRRYSDPRFPGWELSIPDQLRADAFLTALAEFERAGSMPEFVIVYLPNDHTAGSNKDFPTPRAFVADNDLALGRVVEGLSRSRFWNDMAVFVNEDDPQSGVDHVDGHRSLCLVAGPYVKRGGAAISRFYNQDSVLHTICRIFGAPPMNQLVAMAPLMDECFQDVPNVSRYTCVPAEVPLDEMNPGSKVAGGGAPAQRVGVPSVSKTQAALAPLIADLDYSKPDQLGKKGELFSRYVWSTVRGDEPFPVEYSGNHGRGLKPLGLTRAADEDDDD